MDLFQTFAASELELGPRDAARQTWGGFGRAGNADRGAFCFFEGGSHNGGPDLAGLRPESGVDLNIKPIFRFCQKF